MRKGSWLAVAAAMWLVFDGPRSAWADCTSSLTYKLDAEGEPIPARTVQCALTEEEKLAAESDLAAKLDACRVAGFGDACARLAADHDRAVRRHTATRALARGIDAEQVAERTGLSLEEVEARAAELGLR